MDSVQERIKQIDIENFIWIIYFFLIGLCIYSNYYEKKYFINNDYDAKEKYRKITIFIFTVAILIYLYFFIDGYNEVKNLGDNVSNKKKNLNKLSFIGSSLILISGFIFLYIAIIDEDLDVELAFN